MTAPFAAIGDPSAIAIFVLLPFHPRRARDQLLGRAAHQDDRAVLRRRPPDQRLPERHGARRRLHERRELPRHRRPRGPVRLRRPHLLDRLPRRLADRPLPDRRAAPQPRQVHVRRRRRVPPEADAGAHGRRGRDALGRGLLPHRADGRRRGADHAHVRHRLRTGRGHRRLGHAGPHPLRRHDRDDLGADRQGDAAPRRRARAGPLGALVLQLEPARALRLGRHGQRRRRCSRPATRS